MMELKVPASTSRTTTSRIKYKHLKTKESKLLLKEKSKSAAEIIYKAYVRDTYFKTKLTNAAGNPKEVFKIVKYLFGKDVKPSCPTANNNENLAENFAQFFKSKIQKLY